MASEDGFGALRLEYRGVLVKEIRMHRIYSIVALTTGVGLLGLGIFVSPSYPDFGWLLALVGALRSLTALYDVGRKDQLQKNLERIDRMVRGKLGIS